MSHKSSQIAASPSERHSQNFSGFQANENWGLIEPGVVIRIAGMSNRARDKFGKNTRLVTGCISLAALLHLVAAWYNVGNFHADGHFQILEFANYKLGNIDSSGLPWEFFWQIRPAIQPAMAFLVHSLAQLAGFGDPFTVTFLLRFISATVGLLAALLLGFYALRWISSKTLRHWLIPACCLFWLLPFVHSTFMSENWSGSLLCLGAVFVLMSCQGDLTNQALRQAFLGGLLLGFCVYIRFPVAFAVAGLSLWVLVVSRPPQRYLAALAAGFLVAVLINLCLDYWLYDEWVFTPLAYFESNIIQGRAGEFGVDPWWYYLPRLIGILFPPWALVFLPALILAVVRRPGNPLVWILIPFLLFHSIVGHKETRFLIPIINLLPILVLLGLDCLQGRIRAQAGRFSRSAVGFAVIGLFVALNFMLMLLVTIIPAHQSAVIQGWIHQRAEEKPFTLNFHTRDPYEQAGLTMNYYKTPAVTLKPIETYGKLCEEASQTREAVLIFLPAFDPPPDSNHCLEWMRLTSSVDRGPLTLLPEGWLLGRNIWTIYRGVVVIAE